MGSTPYVMVKADAPGLRAITAGRLKHIGDQAIKRLGIDHLIGGGTHHSNSAKGKARRQQRPARRDYMAAIFFACGASRRI